MTALWVARLIVAAACSAQQTTVSGDARVHGSLAVGTSAPSARFEVQAASATEIVLQVSGIDTVPYLAVDKAGRVALSTTAAARLDVWGLADSSDTAVQLLGGGLYPASTGYQLLMAYAGDATHRHALRTRHSTSTVDSSIDFLLWTPAQAASAIGSMPALSLVTASTGAAVHVRPATGTVTLELVVSDGATLGAGAVHRAVEATHSARSLKADIRYLDDSAAKVALAELATLKPVRFRYRGQAAARRGLLFEEAPISIRGPGGLLSVDQRVLNAELAFKGLAAELEATRGELQSLEGAPR